LILFPPPPPQGGRKYEQKGIWGKNMKKCKEKKKRRKKKKKVKKKKNREKLNKQDYFSLTCVGVTNHLIFSQLH
jgi:hypothetical protein